MARYLVAGAGAIGSWLGLRLSEAGHEVVLWRRSGGPVTVDGVRLEAIRGVPRDAVDGVFVTCKAHQTSQVADALRDTDAPFYVSLQNGLGNREILLRHLGPCVAVAVTSHGVMQTAAHAYEHRGSGPTVVGSASAKAGPAAYQALRDAGLDPSWTDDVEGSLWWKAAINAAINPLAALGGHTNGELLEHWDEVETLASEVYALGRAHGVDLTGVVDATRATLERTRGNRCSMLQDVAARRPTEIEQITGAFVRTARRLGHPLPENEAVYRRLKALEEEYLGANAVLLRAREAAQ